MELEQARPAVRIRDLSVQIGGHTILENVNLTIRRGEKIVITGRNGAGKTTLLKIILGLISPAAGLCDVDLSKGIKNGLAYLNQQSIYVDFPISALEVAEMGVVARKISKAERVAEIRQAMETTRCEHLINRSYRDLSGGEKQKVSLARCLAQKAEILLLDEPCSSLDAESKAEILAILDELNRRFGTTVVMVSHDEETTSRDGWVHMHLQHGAIAETTEQQL